MSSSLLLLYLLLSLSSLSSSVLASRSLASGHVAILTRLSPSGIVTTRLTNGEVVMNYKLEPFPSDEEKAGIKSCELSFDSMESRHILNHEDVKVEFFGEEVIANLVDACNKISLWGGVNGIASKILLPKYKSFTFDPANKINIPGTKWCGPGDTAKDENDLGELADLDRCCRSHNLCPYNIKAFQTKDHYWNSRPHTVSSCICDESFFNCLKDVTEHSKVAATVGRGFFDTLGPPCVKKQHGKYCHKWHWTYMWCEATAEGLAAIPYNYLDGGWGKGNSVAKVLELRDTPATQIPPIKS